MLRKLLTKLKSLAATYRSKQMYNPVDVVAWASLRKKPPGRGLISDWFGFHVRSCLGSPPRVRNAKPVVVFVLGTKPFDVRFVGVPSAA